MTILETEILGNPLRDWLLALGIALSINLAFGIFKWAITRRLARKAQSTSSPFVDALLAVSQSTRQWLIFGITLFAGSHYLDLPDRAEIVMKSIGTIAAFLQVGLWLGAAINFWLNRYRLRTLQLNAAATTSLAAVSFIVQVLLWTFILLVALDNLGIDVTALVAGLGVGGIAVALAVQNVLGDLFASLSIVMDKPFVIGDFIVVDDYSGTVEHVGLKTTRIRSLSGEQLVISNSDLLKARLRNYKRMQERRIVFTFSVPMQTTPELAEKIPGIVRGIIETQKQARFERAHLLKFGTGSLDYEVVYWMKTPDYDPYMDTQQAINLGMLRSFARDGIKLSDSSRTILVEQERIAPKATAKAA